jgi:ComF family protein
MGTPAVLARVVIDFVGDVLAPPKCAACDAYLGRRAVFCGACASTVERAAVEHATGGGAERPSAQDLAAFVYGGAVARAITRFKYERRPDLARPLGDLLWRAVEPNAAAHAEAIVVPVPLHPARLAERGYNQSALVSRVLARHLGAPWLPVALVRARDTPRQAALDRDARRANVDGAFVARQPSCIAGRRVLLVDDVRTTGSTLRACERALFEAGSLAVTTAVIARAV